MLLRELTGSPLSGISLTIMCFYLNNLKNGTSDIKKCKKAKCEK